MAEMAEMKVLGFVKSLKRGFSQPDIHIVNTASDRLPDIQTTLSNRWTNVHADNITMHKVGGMGGGRIFD